MPSNHTIAVRLFDLNRARLRAQAYVVKFMLFVAVKAALASDDDDDEVDEKVQIAMFNSHTKEACLHTRARTFHAAARCIPWPFRTTAASWPAAPATRQPASMIST